MEVLEAIYVLGDTFHEAIALHDVWNNPKD